MLRIPLLHFLALGGALFLAARLHQPAEVIRVQDSDLAQLRREWMQNTGRPSTPPELQASLRQWLSDEALLREALKLGLDRDDPVVNQRLARNLRFAFPDRSGGDAALADEGRQLGMVAQDFVIRRRLVQLMEQRMLESSRFTDAELRDYLARNRQRYAQSPRYDYRQIYVADEARARQLAQRLRAGEDGAVLAGDAFALGAERRGETVEDITRLLGAELADAVAGAAVDEWRGPIASAYGWHLVRVSAMEPAAAWDFAQQRPQLALALQAERRKEIIAAGRTRLLARYRVELPEGLVLP